MINKDRELSSVDEKLHKTEEELKDSAEKLTESQKDISKYRTETGLKMWEAKGKERKYKDQIEKVNNELFAIARKHYQILRVN